MGKLMFKTRDIKNFIIITVYDYFIIIQYSPPMYMIKEDMKTILNIYNLPNQKRKAVL